MDRQRFRLLYPLTLIIFLFLMLAQTGWAQGDPPTAIMNNTPEERGAHTFSLIAVQNLVNLGQGVFANAVTFNGTVPGPALRLRVGDRVIVRFFNLLPTTPLLPSGFSIHWHGIELDNASDGTGLTQNQVNFLGQYTYKFIVPRPGIFFYHSHIMPTNPEFKGYYGPMIVEDPVEGNLIALRVLPDRNQTKLLVLGDTTVCKAAGFNDTATFAPDPTGTVPWAGTDELPGNPTFPGLTAVPTPKDLCEKPRADDGTPLATVPVPLPAGSIPNIQPAHDCDTAHPPCRTNEGQLVLTNGKIPAPRAGKPSAPGSVAPGAQFIDVKSGDGIRLQLASAAATRYFRLRMTNQSGNMVSLYRVGGDGGLLDRVRLEGGSLSTSPAGTFDTHYFKGEILLPVAGRADVVFVPYGNIGDVLTLWTLDYRRIGGGGFVGLPTVPVAHFRIVGTGGNFTIAEGDALRVHPAVNNPVENLKAAMIAEHLLNPANFSMPLPGSSDETIRLKTAGLPSIDNVDGFTFDAGAGPPPADFHSVPHIGSSRYAHLGDLLELTVSNDSTAHHPWHAHGFSFQPVRLINHSTSNALEFNYQEFVDTVDVPPGFSLVYRVRLTDRPMADFTTPGGALGRWAFHCHIFFHAANGMISELVVLP